MTRQPGSQPPIRPNCAQCGEPYSHRGTIKLCGLCSKRVDMRIRFMVLQGYKLEEITRAIGLTPRNVKNRRERMRPEDLAAGLPMVPLNRDRVRP